MLTGLLEALGFGGSVMTAAMLVLAVLYLRRVAQAGSLVVGLASAGLAYAVAILAVAAVAIGLGWVDPHPGRMFEHAHSGAQWGWEFATGPLRSLVDWLRAI